MAVFHFELVAPDRLQFNGPAQAVLVPGRDGDFQVLRDHAAMMTSLRPGVVVVEEEGGKSHRFFVRGGFAEVNPAGLTVLAETAVPETDLNAAHLEEEIKAAEVDLAEASDDNKQAAQEKLDQLRELKGSMKL